MATLLAPPVNQLGIMAPVLGPWFDDPALVLPVPNAANGLAVDVTLTAVTSWLPPATGTLSLYVSDAVNQPAALAELQDPNGNSPFPAGRLLGYFRLLPEVEARLDELMRFVPAATSAALAAVPVVPNAAPSRPRVRSFVLMPQIPGLTHNDVMSLFGGAANVPGDDDGERLAALGLALVNGAVTNGAIPMTWLRRPGVFDPPILDAKQDLTLSGMTGTIRLWAFDDRGRPVDPGAVAAWWSWLLTDAIGDAAMVGPNPPANPPNPPTYQLLAPGLKSQNLPQQGARRMLCNAAAALTVHLVDPHEGPLAAPLLGARLVAAGAPVTSTLVTVAGSTTFSFPAPGTSGVPALPTPTGPANRVDNPAADDAPLGRVAALPNGNYLPTVTVWPNGAVIAGLGRDFVRVAALDEEYHLLGVRRLDSRQPVTKQNPTPAEVELGRRGASQNRPSTRTTVSRTATLTPVLLTTADAATTALVGLFGTGNPARAVFGVADAAWGPPPPALAAGAAAFPMALTDDPILGASSYRVRALVGGGAANAGQMVLVEVNLGVPNAGTWVRAWPLGFDLTSGTHFRLTGGGGRVDATGVARLVMTLPNGRVDAAGLLGMDLLATHPLAAGFAQRSYADCRFSRPTAVAGNPANAATDIVAGTSWAVCETGATGTGPLPVLAPNAVPTVPSGATLVITGATPAIVAPASIPLTARPGVLGARLAAGDIISLTEPAYASTPDRADALGRPLARGAVGGNPLGNLAPGAPATVHRVPRSGQAVIASSAPYALQDRLEVAAAVLIGAGAPRAVIAAAPPLPWVHEVAPGFLGHPGVPAAIEIHGTGVVLDGPPAVAVAEFVRERTAGLAIGAIQNAPADVQNVVVQSEFALVAEAAMNALPAPAAGAGAGTVVAVLRTGPIGQEGLPGVAKQALTQPAGNPAYPMSQVEPVVVQKLDNLIGPLPLGIPSNVGTLLQAQVNPADVNVARAFDRRIQVGAYGAREVAVSVVAALGRAQDLIYIETPAIDALAYDPAGEAICLWDTLVDRLGARPALRVVLCVPTLLMPGTPKKLQAARDSAFLDALATLQTATGDRADRVALFSPGAGVGRAIRFASTTVVVDDVYAVTGTTHLWRRGLTYDSSLAAVVFDERVTAGRSAEVRAFRRQLMADRIGIPVASLPDDAEALVRAVRALDQQGSARLSATAITRPAEPFTPNDYQAWNTDGTVFGDQVGLGEIMQILQQGVALTGVDQAIVEG